MPPYFIEMSPKCLEKDESYCFKINMFIQENTNSTKYDDYNNCGLYVKIVNEGLTNILLCFDWDTFSYSFIFNK